MFRNNLGSGTDLLIEGFEEELLLRCGRPLSAAASSSSPKIHEDAAVAGSMIGEYFFEPSGHEGGMPAVSRRWSR